MISHIRGKIEAKNTATVVVDACGLGYEVFVPASTSAALPETGKEVKLYVTESTSMYGGGTTLYGFLTVAEKEVFSLLRDEVPGAGAKKALEYMDKVTKSVADFKRAVAEKDAAALTGVFGFTKKTADKLIAALKDKVGEIQLDAGKDKGQGRRDGNPRAEAISGLLALGYRENQAREAVDAALNAVEGKVAVETLIKLALRHL